MIELGPDDVPEMEILITNVSKVVNRWNLRANDHAQLFILVSGRVARAMEAGCTVPANNL